jgi:hypothetical protein
MPVLILSVFKAHTCEGIQVAISGAETIQTRVTVQHKNSITQPGRVPPLWSFFKKNGPGVL